MQSSNKKIVPTLAEFGSSAPLPPVPGGPLAEWWPHPASYPVEVGLVGSQGAAVGCSWAGHASTALGRLTA